MKKMIILLLTFIISLSMTGCELMTNVLDKANNAWDVVSNDLVGQLFKDVDINNITNDIEFPVEFKDYNVSYESLNEGIIDNTGKITRKENDETVKVVITFTKTDDESKTESYVVSFTVKGYLNNDPVTDDEKTSAIKTETKTNTQSKTTDNTITESKTNNISKETKAPSLEELSKDLDNVKVEAITEYTDKEDEEYTIEDTATYIYTSDKIYWITASDYYFYTAEYENLYVIGEELDLFYFDIDEEYYYVDSTSEYFEYLGAYDYPIFNFDDDDFSITAIDGGYEYEVISKKLAKYGNIFFTDYVDESESYTYDFNSIKVVVINNQISEMTIEFTYTESYDEESYEFDVISYISFSGYGEQEIEVFEATKISDEEIEEIFGLEEEKEQEETEDIYYIYSDEVEEKTVVAVNGNIIGKDSKEFFVYDGDTAITCYYGTSSKYDWSSLNIGDYVSLTGTKSSYKGLVEVLVDAKSVDVDDTKFKEYESFNLEYVSDIDDKLNQGKVVNINNYIVTKEYQKRNSTSSDHIIEVKDENDDKITICFKGSIASNLKSTLSNYKVGDSITINNLVVYWYNGVQLQGIDTTNINDKYLTLSTKKITVDYGTSLNDAIKDLVVTLDGETITEYTIESSEYDENTSGTYSVLVSYNDKIAYLSVVVLGKPEELTVDEETTRLKDAAENNNLTYGISSTGDVNVLVIPIEFSDKKFEEDYKTRLNLAFNGTSEETGYESLNSYYKKSSYNKLNLTATILDAYMVDDTWKKVKNATAYDYLDYKYLLAAITYYDETIDYSIYDSNNDGYIDCVYLVYSAPYNSDSEDSTWWAYTNEYIEEDEEALFDGLGLDYYIFFSYEFINDPIMEGEDERKTTDDTYINVNAVTIIHETGHALGLDDYYDYTLYEGPAGGIGGGDMMDYNVGDHNAYSKAILGWIDPKVLINITGEYTLNSFAETGDSIIIAKNWNDSLFTEYYIIDFYTPTGVNELTKGYTGSFSEKGVRIYHIYSTLDSSKNMTAAYDMTIYDNSDTKYKLIALVEADGENNITKDSLPYGGYSEDSDLFSEGDSYTFKWYDGTSSNITMNVISIDDSAVISFTK